MAPYVLIADDEPAVLELLGELFSDDGYDVHLVRDGREAIASIQQKMPDLLVLDIMMPRLNGLDVLNELERLKLTLPIIVMTASSIAYQFAMRTHSGLVYFQKPFDAELLLETAARLLASREAG